VPLDLAFRARPIEERKTLIEEDRRAEADRAPVVPDQTRRAYLAGGCAGSTIT
jgi:hypothetical protein